MKSTTIFFLINALKQEQEEQHQKFIYATDFLYNPKTNKIDISPKEYNKIANLLHKGYLQKRAKIEEIITELKQLLPKQ